MQRIVFLSLLTLSMSLFTCKSVPKEEDSAVKLEAACNRVSQRANLLMLSCGNAKCEKLIENEQSCPEDCSDPKKQIISYYAQAHVCPKTVVHHPKDFSELLKTMKDVRARNKRIKPVGSSHSITDIKCAASDGEAVVMAGLNKIIGIEDYQGTKTVHLESAVRFWDLVNWLEKEGYALDARIPGMGVITVGGFVATGAHGSNALGSGTISSSVVSLEVVGADGNAKVYDKSNTSPDQWAALRANLGLLGVVTKIRLEVMPRYNMYTEIRQFKSDVVFSGRATFEKAIEGCKFVFGHYLRGRDRTYFTCGKETQEKAEANAQNLLFKPPTQSIFTGLAVSGLQQTVCSQNAQRLLEKTIDDQRQQNPWLVWKDAQGKDQRGWKVTGPWHHMMETLFTIEGQPRFSQLDWEVAIPMSEYDGVARELKAFMDKYDVIIPQIGVIFRFDASNTDTIMAASGDDGTIAKGERMIHIEIPIFVPFAFTREEQEVIRKPYRDFMITLVEKYRARPHYGKNDGDFFLSPVVQKRMKASLDRFNAVRKQMDPQGVFLNEYMQKSGFN